jgi:hypothetical protein
MRKIIILLLVTISVMCIAGQLVYITPKGKKYHSTRDCRTLARSKKVIEIDISQVFGRQPCKVCY